MATSSTQQPERYDDEIDLVELIANLWKEKWVIAASTLLITIIGGVYAFTSTPIYRASAQIQTPSSGDLAELNNTQIISTNPNKVFSDFLGLLESDAHKSRLINEHKPTIAEALGIPEDKITIETLNLENLYTINFPPKKKLENSLEPDIYSITTEGENRTALAKLINQNVELATAQLLNQWKLEFDKIKSVKSNKINSDFDLLKQNTAERRENKITQLTEQHKLQIKNIQDELNGRKSYVLNIRKDRISELKEAIKIAGKLGIIQPSTLSRLSRSNLEAPSSSSQVEVNTEIKGQGEPLYLRGTNLLIAELESLESLSSKTFLDTRIRELETTLATLKNNREIEILKARESDKAFNEELQSLQEQLRKLDGTIFPQDIKISFLNDQPNTPAKPIKPKKLLIIVISSLLGGIIGLFIAIGRIIYKNAKLKETD